MDREEISWLSTKEAARRLGIANRTLYRLMDEGQIAAYRFGRVYRIQEADVDAFIDGARIEPGSLAHLYSDPAVDAESTAAES